MKTEFEAKFYPVDKQTIRKKLKKVNARLDHKERLMRRVIFDHRENPGIKADYLRVRDEGDSIRLSAKVHAVMDGKLEDQKELDVKVEDFDKMIGILETAGLVKSAYQETLRETWELDDAEVVIDSWPSLETYIEVEAESEAKVQQVAEKLGFKWEDRIITSVVEIYEKVYGVSNSEVHRRIKNSTFGSPPF